MEKCRRLFGLPLITAVTVTLADVLLANHAHSTGQYDLFCAAG